MAVVPLIFYPSPGLRQVALPVPEIMAADVWQLVLDLEETMKAKNGLGLAAPQIGVGRRVIVVKVDDGILALINPQFTDAGRERELGEEGCLSIPGLFGLVERTVQINVMASSANGQQLRFSAQGLLARVIQHEVDHLNGVLIIDRMHTITAGADRLRELWQAGGRP